MKKLMSVSMLVFALAAFTNVSFAEVAAAPKGEHKCECKDCNHEKGHDCDKAGCKGKCKMKHKKAKGAAKAEGEAHEGHAH